MSEAGNFLNFLKIDPHLLNPSDNPTGIHGALSPEGMVLLKTHLDELASRIKYYQKRVALLEAEFRQVQSMCGNPNAVDACRLISRAIDEVLK